MHTRGAILFCFVASGAFAAGETTGTSARLRAEIRATLPSFSSLAATSTNTATTGEASSDPNVLVLPKLTVREKRLPKMDPELLRNQRDIQKQAMREYKNSMTPLEWALNSWFIPLVTPPVSARARAAYDSKKFAEQLDVMNRLTEVDKLLGTSDGGVKKAVGDMQKADDWQSRPAGGK